MLALGLLSSENRFTPQATGRRICESPTSVSFSYELVSQFCRFGGIWGNVWFDSPGVLFINTLLSFVLIV